MSPTARNFRVAMSIIVNDRQERLVSDFEQRFRGGRRLPAINNQTSDDAHGNQEVQVPDARALFHHDSG